MLWSIPPSLCVIYGSTSAQSVSAVMVNIQHVLVPNRQVVSKSQGFEANPHQTVELRLPGQSHDDKNTFPPLTYIGKQTSVYQGFIWTDTIVVIPLGHWGVVKGCELLGFSNSPCK